MLLKKNRFYFFLTLFIGLSSHAADYKFTHIQPAPKNIINNCEGALNSQVDYYLLVNPEDKRLATAKSIFYERNNSNLLYEDLLPIDSDSQVEPHPTVHKILKQWEEENIFPEGLVEKLKQRESILDKKRSALLFFELRDEYALIRLYDGSDTPQFFQEPWKEIPSSPLPMEAMDPGILADYRKDLDEKFSPSNYNILEAGLLGQSPLTARGAFALAQALAGALDFNYGKSHFALFRENKILDNVILVAEATPRMAKIYQRFGFSPVKNADGSTLTNPNGLIILEVSAKNFVDQNFKLPTQPQYKGQNLPNTTPETEDQREEKYNNTDERFFYRSFLSDYYTHEETGTLPLSNLWMLPTAERERQKRIKLLNNMATKSSQTPEDPGFIEWTPFNNDINTPEELYREHENLLKICKENRKRLFDRHFRLMGCKE